MRDECKCKYQYIHIMEKKEFWINLVIHINIYFFGEGGGGGGGGSGGKEDFYCSKQKNGQKCKQLLYTTYTII